MSESDGDEDFICPHINLNTVDTLNCGRKILKPESWDKCHNNECTLSSNSLFACLKCGYISCVDENNAGHAKDHFLSKRRIKHPIAMDIHSHELWCFICEEQVFNDTAAQSISSLSSALKSLQQRHLTRIKSDDDVIVVSSIKAKEFEEKDKAENANAHYQITLIRKVFNYWKNNSKTKVTNNINMTKKKLSGNKRKRKNSKKIENEEKQINGNTNTAVKNNNNKSNSCPPKKKLKRSMTKNFAGRTGLRNLGNTCYFNSAVQCLNSTDTFRKFFLNLPSLVPENALTAPLPDLPALKAPSNTRNKRRNVKRTVQTRSSFKKTNRSLSNNQKNKNLKSKKKASIEPKRRRSARLRNKRIENDSSDDTEMCESNHSNNSNISSTDDDTSGTDSTESNKSLLAPSRLLLRRRTTSLLRSMENDEELQDNVSLSAEIYSLLRIFESGKYSVITPQRLAMTIWNIVPQFRSYKQQDAQEFLSLFLDRLQQEIHAFDDGQHHGNKNNKNKNNKQIQRPSHYVKQSFECSMISETICDKCTHKSYYRPPGHKFMTLDIYGAIEKILQNKKTELERVDENDTILKTNVNKNNKKKGRGRRGRNGSHLTLRQLNTTRAFDRTLKSYPLCSLTDLLNTINAPIIFDGDNMYKCDTCNKKVTAIKRDYYEILPNVLVFHLCRAYYNLKNNKQEKLQNHIAFPLKNLKMGKYCFNNNTNTNTNNNNNNNDDDNDIGYDLVAALVHSGRSMSHGHYISYCYHKESQRWLKFDDVKVSVINEKTVMKSQAYLLFYEKQNISDWVDKYIHFMQKQMT